MAATEFPALQNDRILRVIKGEKPDKLPVWIMRQAGRFLPEFREFRKQHSFFEICQTPELACEVTLMPIKRFDLDAAIIFSDILVIPQALGVAVEMRPEVGPVIPKPLTLDTIKDLKEDGAASRLNYVGEAIKLTRKELGGKVPLFGFCGAPWTLFGYMVEGGGSKTMSKAKKWLYKNPDEAKKVLDILTNVIIDYLVMQAEYGAQILQVFESSAEYLNRQLFSTFALPYLGRICDQVKLKLKEKNLDVPMVLFAKGAHFSLADQSNLNYDVLGIDWTVEPKIARTLTKDKVVQGNLDPCALYAPKEEIEKLVGEMAKGFGTSKYIVNLGHGIYPDMEVENVKAFIEAVHNVQV
ncbi:uroporphyrinogen decarboxylase [Harmonia axyridis]|uniref:uroporphyrinogen decarboxylase n=1 Tax=Harmonia axyridis TaxID=115357 RepID=UPI001E277880|nr:uroporphyrinogen decarboxylase [Harmonia axyridis]